MARTPQRSSGPGFAGMVVFLVLSAVLLILCVFLATGYLKRGTALTKLQDEIQKDLVKPLRDKGVSVSALAAPSASDVAYDHAFFLKVQKCALDGVAYSSLAEKTGFTGDNAVGDIVAELQKSQTKPEPTTLREYITKLIQDLGTAQRQLGERNQALQLATAQVKDAQARQAQDSKDLKEAVDKDAKDLQDARAGYDRDLATVKQMLAKAETDAKSAWNENRAQAEAFKKQAADWQVKLQKLEDNVRSLNEELTRKMPKAVAVTEGLVLQADPIEGIAIINLGKKEQIENGEKFTVVRAGKGGTRVTKAELQIVRVDQLVSRAEILNADPDDPVMRDDVVVREKKTE